MKSFAVIEMGLHSSSLMIGIGDTISLRTALRPSYHILPSVELFIFQRIQRSHWLSFFIVRPSWLSLICFLGIMEIWLPGTFIMSSGLPPSALISGGIFLLASSRLVPVI